ncbi:MULTISPECIES: hypothetical protein [Microseira]|jgi:hypothetical protein|uniref:Uncharacterized protein n=1 Tax=Microseira wollei NIES-4236 TaxID=2530354 RepID=A0AAV3XN26_9CYAN|nr:hypothetical protein [Microseira wollei]GET43713.1 hypothetical protein MiSe_85380 [Microseira wollei NIES-4236]
MKLRSDVCTRMSPSTPVSVGSVGAWERLCDRTTPPAPKFAPSVWVKVLNPPTAFSFDEAWLLCEYSENQWLAWIPDYGEILLRIDEFCSLER